MFVYIKKKEKRKCVRIWKVNRTMKLITLAVDNSSVRNYIVDGSKSQTNTLNIANQTKF